VTAPVVPESAKESSTQSPGLVAMWITRCMSCSGFGVENGVSPGNKAVNWAFALPVVPTSSCIQMVDGTSPACTSDKNFLTRGALPPASPNQMRLSANISARRSSV